MRINNANGAPKVEDLKAKLERFKHEREQSKSNLLKLKHTPADVVE